MSLLIDKNRHCTARNRKGTQCGNTPVASPLAPV